MSRGLSDTYVTSSAAIVYPAVAVYMDFAGVDGSGNITGSAPVRLWSGQEDKFFNDDFGSGSYTGAGTLGTISAINETTEVASKQVSLTLSGIPNEYVALALANPYRDRPVSIEGLFFNEDYTSYEQVTIFRGRMDQMTINDGEETSNIILKCESRLVDLNRFHDVRYTDEAQRTINPDDNGLVFISSLFNKSIYWGASAPTQTFGSPNGGGGTQINDTQHR